MTKPKELPRENLVRSVDFTFLRAADAADDEQNDGRTFVGYGAVFNSPTRINSWEGDFDEQIAPGAFRKSLRERTPKFQFDHGHHPLIGSIPIGMIEDIHEDDRGLYVQARLGEHIIIDLIREAIASGAIDGMSFRFSVVRDEWRDKDGKTVKPEDVKRILYYGEQPERTPLLRILKEVRVAEVGPVVWPAYDGTSAAVRAKLTAADGTVHLNLDRLNKPEEQRKLLLVESALRALTPAPSGEASDEEPRDTPDDGAVEHSDEDNAAPQSTDSAGEHADDSPRSTDDSAGEHESDSHSDAPPATDDPVDAARAAAVERLFQGAFDLVRNTREATPPPTNV
ncbi:HK97 family phage prohead protease [Mycolicibacterium canariasense]|nr:HK97 family phage prohead protease [Mycolicibacterium canariasense]